MIKSTSYEKSWIMNLKKKYKKIDPIICEKMIRAIGLLEQLVIFKLDFIFKGGTSLILLIDNPQRFSIDIDINTESSNESIISILSKICSTNIFIRYEENIRKQSKIPKAHYKLYFDSSITGQESYILLDVLFEEALYSKTIQTEISSIWVDSSNDGKNYNVTTPTIDSILGDKLTVFAPHSTGIPYNVGKSMEIIKQLFDIGRLFDLHKDLVVVATSFKAIAIKELEYKENLLSLDDVLLDIIKTSLLISFFPIIEKSDNISEVKELFDGLKRFNNYPIDITYRADDAILSAAKTALLAAIIKANNFEAIIFYSEKSNHAISDFHFLDKYKHLRKLKKRKKEAYYYWVLFFQYVNDGLVSIES